MRLQFDFKGPADEVTKVFLGGEVLLGPTGWTYVHAVKGAGLAGTIKFNSIVLEANNFYGVTGLAAPNWSTAAVIKYGNLQAVRIFANVAYRFKMVQVFGVADPGVAHVAISQ